MQNICICLMTFFVATNAIAVRMYPIRQNKDQDGGLTADMECISEVVYEFCTWRHKSQECLFEYKSKINNITMQSCESLKNRVQFIGDYASKQCGIRLSNIRKEDEGEWSCEMEAYVYGPLRGYTAKGSQNLTIKFEDSMIESSLPAEYDLDSENQDGDTAEENPNPSEQLPAPDNKEKPKEENKNLADNEKTNNPDKSGSTVPENPLQNIDTTTDQNFEMSEKQNPHPFQSSGVENVHLPQNLKTSFVLESLFFCYVSSWLLL